MRRRYQQNVNDISTEYKRRDRDTRPLPPTDMNTVDGAAPRAIYFEVMTDAALADDDTPPRIYAYTHREIIIGRRSRPQDPNVQVDLNPHHGHALGVSRVHAMVAIIQNKLTLQDLNSVNGTLINNRQALPLERYILQDGDIIMLGNFKLMLHFVTS